MISWTAKIGGKVI